MPNLHDIVQYNSNSAQKGYIFKTCIYGISNSYVIRHFDGPMHAYNSTKASIKDNIAAVDTNRCAGTISATKGSTTITGTGTDFTGELAAGAIIACNCCQHTVVSIESATSLTVAAGVMEDLVNKDFICVAASQAEADAHTALRNA